MKPYPKPEAKKRRKKPAKSEHKILVEKLDFLVRTIVHKRDHETCVICGSTARPQTGHLFVRGRMRVRWDLRNCHIQCAACNLRHRYDQAPYFHWYIHNYGIQAFEELYRLAEGEPYYKWTTDELVNMCTLLGQELLRQ